MLSKLFMLGGTTNFEMLWLVMILFQMVHGMGEVGGGGGGVGGIVLPRLKFKFTI